MKKLILSTIVILLININSALSLTKFEIINKNLNELLREGFNIIDIKSQFTNNLYQPMDENSINVNDNFLFFSLKKEKLFFKNSEMDQEYKDLVLKTPEKVDILIICRINTNFEIEDGKIKRKDETELQVCWKP